MLAWLKDYRRGWLAGDLGAGAVVAMMMIPQGMAYALVAGLPPVTGIYASIVPPLLYAVFGTSSTQSVGPMAIISLMTASVLAPMAAPGSALYGALAGQLALLAGLVLLACGLLRVGFLANFFSRPVMNGFTIGSSILIAHGQLGVLLGARLPHWHRPSAALGLGALALLLLARRYGARLLQRCGLAPGAADIGARLAPMLLVAGSIAAVAALGLDRMGVQVIGRVPAGLPRLNLAASGAHWQQLFQPALLIGFMCFLISMSGAQALAARKGEKLHTNAELVGLGAANVGSFLSGGFPVTGSLSRSAVNFAAGANTPLAAVVAAALLGAALVLPTGWLALLPLPVLAATIIVAVLGMLESATLRTAWRYDRADALALLATLGGVLLLGVEAGVVVGLLLSLGAMIWRESRPHIAVLGRIAGTEHFRNVERYQAETRSGVLLLRVDAGLFFGNIEAVNARVEEELDLHPGTRELVLVLSAVNAIDTSALFGLLELNGEVVRRGVRLHLAEVKGPVMDRLKQSKLLERLSGQVFLSTANAWNTLSTGDESWSV
ncbi:sulfate:proton symporter [Massilia sp. WF1]|uniref:SulP family inorganic anion transporter n=1 Tax=unclassified Massilia TaxID=2609279 RepID=UPI00064A6FE4|nr:MULTISPECIES: SulP family inorganic anion transporter [unclassified Massilia]ALK96900.1 sulfate:proton symporter [Massilia sp. WG5]KLU37967.1 sulfate:proton symporter [Massilia sp. WF1]